MLAVKRSRDENRLDVRIPVGSCPVEFTSYAVILGTFSTLDQTRIQRRGLIADLLLKEPDPVYDDSFAIFM